MPYAHPEKAASGRGRRAESAGSACEPRLGEPDLPLGVELLVGHTESQASKLWIRGCARYPSAEIFVCAFDAPDPSDGDGKWIESGALELSEDADYTSVWKAEGLAPATRHRIMARYYPADPNRDPVVLRRGEFRTFPDASAAGENFSFIFGSCNLSTSRLSRLGRFAAGYLGLKATESSTLHPDLTWHVPPDPGRLRKYQGGHRRFWFLQRLVRWLDAHSPLRRSASRGAATASKRILQGLVYLTRFEAPESFLPSPFLALREEIESTRAGIKPAFMLHVGDQIYFDVDLQKRMPSLREYRNCYQETWTTDPHLRELFASLPHYMILDDHEVVDNLGTWGPARDDPHLPAAMHVYREYVDCHNPDRAHTGHDYSFQHGPVQFFVLDVRTERDAEAGHIIGPLQLERFSAWLEEHAEALKFVVSSVPFLAEIKLQAGDKWCGEKFQDQRDQIYRLCYEKQIERLIFLTGDVHCCYHSSVTIGPPRDRVTVHELGSGPFHQLHFSPRETLEDHHRGTIMTTDGRPIPYRSMIHDFYAASNAATRVSVASDGQELRWQVIPMSGPVMHGAGGHGNLQGKIAF